MMELGLIYIADLNPFQLLAPPGWWQQGLWAFDSDLRILPSRQRPHHHLARVRKYSKGLTEEAFIDKKTNTLIQPENDTAMFVKHGLIPVTWIASTEGWTEGFLQYVVGELAERDTWAVEGQPLTEDLIKQAMFEGGSKYGRLMDERDEAARQKLDAEVHDDVYHATGDAWRSLQARTGERVLNAGMPSDQSVTDSATTKADSLSH